MMEAEGWIVLWEREDSHIDGQFPGIRIITRAAIRDIIHDTR